MKAWEYEHKKLHGASPVDFEEDPSDWSGVDRILKSRRELISLHWASNVPGSRAPESIYLAMIQAWYNRGYDVSGAEKLIETALREHKKKNFGELEKISGQILKRLLEAPGDLSHKTWSFERPDTWIDIRSSFRIKDETFPGAENIKEKILGGWNGQIAGGSYGTALEGYSGKTLRAVYGDRLDFYIKEPETLNDDITYELAVLKAAELKGSKMGSEDIADMWLKYIPFGWSAEYFALENLRRGFYPPESGKLGNFFSEWIGAQMRTMVCGYLAPGDPVRAAEYAYMDSCVSHETNGIYGGIHSAVLSSLAFVMNSAK
ncbi:MAG: ADP-ribosylglycohydrolase family protein, partial [Proteobacteria bacterium]|nr:ADP-ribosylglycohydrolase family protein [Pseudomonadota bacterium]